MDNKEKLTRKGEDTLRRAARGIGRRIHLLYTSRQFPPELIHDIDAALFNIGRHLDMITTKRG